MVHCRLPIWVKVPPSPYLTQARQQQTSVSQPVTVLVLVAVFVPLSLWLRRARLDSDAVLRWGSSGVLLLAIVVQQVFRLESDEEQSERIDQALREREALWVVAVARPRREAQMFGPYLTQAEAKRAVDSGVVLTGFGDAPGIKVGYWRLQGRDEEECDA